MFAPTHADLNTAQAAQSTASSPVAEAIVEIERTANRLIRAVDELAVRLAPVRMTTVKVDNEVATASAVHSSPMFNALDSLNDRLRYVELELTRVSESLEI